MKRVTLAIATILLLLASSASAQMRTAFPSTEMLTAATTTATGDTLKPARAPMTFHAFGETSAGAGSATIVIEVSNVERPTTNDWLTMGTITLTLGTTRSSDGFSSSVQWRNVRARVTAISGTGASVNVRGGN